jgi:hypothetical protein
MALSTTALATVDVAVGDFEHGLATAWEALELARGMQSWRLTDGLRRLDGALEQHAGRSDVDELRHELALANGGSVH